MTDNLAAIAAAMGTFGMVCGVLGYRIGKEDGRIDERQRLYWRTRPRDRERL